MVLPGFRGVCIVSAFLSAGLTKNEGYMAEKEVDAKAITPTNSHAAPDERMRRALETSIRELERARDYNNAPNSVTITRLKEALSCAADASNASAEARLREALTDIAAISACVAVVENPTSHVKMLSNINAVSVKALKSLAGADEGKESEGGQLPKGLQRAIDDTRAAMDAALSKLPKLKATSDPTPPDATAQREAWPKGCQSPISCSRNHTCMYFQCVHEGRNIEQEIDHALLALSTRAGG